MVWECSQCLLTKSGDSYPAQHTSSWTQVLHVCHSCISVSAACTPQPQQASQAMHYMPSSPRPWGHTTRGRKRSASVAGLSSGHGHSGSEGHYTHSGEAVHTGRVSSPLSRDRRGRGCFRTNLRSKLPESAKKAMQKYRSQDAGNRMDSMSTDDEHSIPQPQQGRPEFVWEPFVGGRAASDSEERSPYQSLQPWPEPSLSPAHQHCSTSGRLLPPLLNKEETASVLPIHCSRQSFQGQSQSMPTIEEEDPHQQSSQPGSWQLVSGLQEMHIQEQ